VSFAVTIIRIAIATNIEVWQSFLSACTFRHAGAGKEKMAEHYTLNSKLGRPRLLVLDRRSILIGLATSIPCASLALGESNQPALIILSKGVTSPIRFTERSPKDPHKTITLTNTSLEGFLVCNGAVVSRTNYKELFQRIGTTYGAGDGKTTFALPMYALQYRSGHPVSGMAICPSSRLALPVGVVVPFDAHN